VRIYAVLLVCAALAACASPGERYYQLNALAKPHALHHSAVSLEVGPVTVPAGLDRPQLVVHGADGRVSVLDQVRWLAPLTRMLPQVLASDLSRELGWGQVHAFPQASALPSDYRLLVDVRSLRATQGQGVYLDASWSLQHQGRTLAVGNMSEEIPAKGPDLDALMRAHDQALLLLARHMARSFPAGVLQ